MLKLAELTATKSATLMSWNRFEEHYKVFMPILRLRGITSSRSSLLDGKVGRWSPGRWRAQHDFIWACSCLFRFDQNKDLQRSRAKICTFGSTPADATGAQGTLKASKRQAQLQNARQNCLKSWNPKSGKVTWLESQASLAKHRQTHRVVVAP